MSTVCERITENIRSLDNIDVEKTYNTLRQLHQPSGSYYKSDISNKSFRAIQFAVKDFVFDYIPNLCYKVSLTKKDNDGSVSYERLVFVNPNESKYNSFDYTSPIKRSKLESLDKMLVSLENELNPKKLRLDDFTSQPLVEGQQSL